MKSVTLSVRLTADLVERLERESSRLARSKSWIISKALEEFLNKKNQAGFLAEARRQSMRVSRKRNRHEEAFWEPGTREWK